PCRRPQSKQVPPWRPRSSVAESDPKRAFVLDKLQTPGLPLFGSYASEIRLVRTRDGAVLSGVVFMRVFGASDLQPLAQRAPISYDRRPRHREDAFILDREFELQPLTLIVGVAYKA